MFKDKNKDMIIKRTDVDYRFILEFSKDFHLQNRKQLLQILKINNENAFVGRKKVA